MDKTIYKKDSKGRIRKTTVYVIGDTIHQVSGLQGGNKTKHSRVAKAKNIGKSNETTPEEQAILEGKAIIVKKLKEGYFDTIEEAENSKVVMPMLAKVYEEEKHKIDWTTAYVQPKMDGIRCLDTVENGKLSRKNTPIDTMDHIVVNRVEGDKTPVDGELYAHGLSFQENMKLIKKLRPGSVKVRYYVYDSISDKPFIERHEDLSAIVLLSDNLTLVPTFKVKNEEELKKYHARFLSQGYEGTMLRWGNEGYKVNGRSSNLLKFKDFLDAAYEVVDVLPSDKNPEQGVVQCKNSSGDVFGCGMKFSHAERKEILANKKDYIGKIAEIRFFEYTDDGLPRFPVCVGFRLDK